MSINFGYQNGVVNGQSNEYTDYLQKMQVQQQQLQADTEAVTGPPPTGAASAPPPTEETEAVPVVEGEGANPMPTSQGKGPWSAFDNTDEQPKLTSPELTASSSAIGMPQLQPLQQPQQGLMQTQQGQIPQIDRPWLMG